ncbi:MAG TPA: PilZ domain-containing protein [Croceicoccus sp.]|nr:PilZ domain-containing protein [Croceicoccus sp.]
MGMAMARTVEKRRDDRVSVRLVTSHDRGDYPLTLLNLSNTGMLLNSPRKLRVGDMVQVDLPKIGATRAQIMWNDADEYGCQFVKQIPDSVVLAAEVASRQNRLRPVPRRRAPVEPLVERDDTRSLVFLMAFLAAVVAIFYAVQAVAT